QHHKDAVDLEVLGLKVWTPLRYIAWSRAETVEEILPREVVQGLWVYLFKGNKGKPLADPKRFQRNKVGKQLKKGDIVQGQVVQLNKNKQNVLLNIEGILTLIPNSDLVWGIPGDLPA